MKEGKNFGIYWKEWGHHSSGRINILKKLISHLLIVTLLISPVEPRQCTRLNLEQEKKCLGHKFRLVFYFKLPFFSKKLMGAHFAGSPHSPGPEYARISTKVGQNTRGKNIYAIKMRTKRSFMQKSVLCLDA